ncbi:hypothetical protein ABZ747_17775 [Kitasatospora cineracea]|uniref:hypothetical protein n=1 Tax=Kitasatospora cineracea TaxID=88074 RepID=UPI00340A2E36
MDSNLGPSGGTDHRVVGGVLSAEAVEALVEESIEQLVADPAPDTLLALLDLLEAAGALWQAVLLVLGPIASRPLPGYSEPEAAGRLHKLAQDTPDAVSALTFTLWATFRAHGTAPARELWNTAPAEIRRGCAAQLLIQYGHCIGADTGTLTPKATVRPLHATVPITWITHQS